MTGEQILLSEFIGETETSPAYPSGLEGVVAEKGEALMIVP